MALSDPFSTTAQLGYEGSSGFGTSFADSLNKVREQQMKGQQAKDLLSYEQDLKNKQSQKQLGQSQAMLQQMGIISQKEEPLTLKDIQDHAKTLGAEINPASDMPEEKQVGIAMKMAQALGIPLPKPKTKNVFDLDAASKAGVDYDTTTGELKFKPPKQEKSLAEQITDAQIAQQAGLDYKGGKAQSKGAGGMGAANVALAEKNAPSIADQVERGDYANYENAPGATKATVSRILEERRKTGTSNVNLTESALGYSGQKGIIKNAAVADAKVNIANVLQDAIDAATDPKTGNIMIPPNMHVELALGVAKMISPTGVVPIELEEQLKQGTFRENAANLAIQLGFDPKVVGGTTQSVTKFFTDTIKRLGMASEQQRENYLKGGRTNYSERFGNKSQGKAVAEVAGVLPTSSKVPTVGTIKGGYKFIGGNPADKNSWEKT